MKTNLFLSITLFLGGALLSAQAQDFRALPPSEQPNAAELAYFGGKNPNSPGNNADAATATTSFSTTSTFRYMPAIQCFGN